MHKGNRDGCKNGREEGVKDGKKEGRKEPRKEGAASTNMNESGSKTDKVD